MSLWGDLLQVLVSFLHTCVPPTAFFLKNTLIQFFAKMKKCAQERKLIKSFSFNGWFRSVKSDFKASELRRFFQNVSVFLWKFSLAEQRKYFFGKGTTQPKSLIVIVVKTLKKALTVVSLSALMAEWRIFIFVTAFSSSNLTFPTKIESLLEMNNFIFGLIFENID